MFQGNYMKPLNHEEKRECFSLLEHFVHDFLEAHKQPVTFTPQNRIDLSSLLHRVANTQIIYEDVKQILRSEVSIYCNKINQELSNTRSIKEYTLCFTYYLDNYLTSINNIVETMFSRVLTYMDNLQGTKTLLEELFRSIVIKTQHDRLSEILLSTYTPNVNLFNLYSLLMLMKLKKKEVMESGGQYKRMREEEVMEEDNQLKRMRNEEEEEERDEDNQLKRMRKDTEGM